MPKVVKRQMEQPDTATTEAAPPAYFLSLTVENVRCFGERQTLDLSDGEGRPAPWTIILGDNGVGKTTLLQCLAALQPVSKEFAEGVGFTPDISNWGDSRRYSFFRNYLGQDALYIESSIAFGNKLSDVSEPSQVTRLLYEQAQYSTPSDELENVLRDQDIKLLHQLKDLKQNRKLVGGTGEKIKELICYGYGASRRMGRGALLDDSGHDSLFSDEVPLINAVEWLLQADYLASRSTGDVRLRLERRRDRIIGVLCHVLPDVEDIKVQDSETETELPTLRIKTPYGWVPTRSLSLGYQTIIAWMVDLASRLLDRYPHSENPLAEPAVVLVDEIDLHLHPRWQRKLIQHLSDLFPNTQFIATAHSPLVVQAACDANIVLLRREGDHVVIDNDVKAISGWRVDQVLTSDLFGLPSARPPQLDGLLDERDKILGKANFTKTDEKKLAQVEAKIGELPTGETPADLEAMDIIRQAAAEIRKQRASVN